MKKGPVTPKGFRDIKPDLAYRRREIINQIANVLESYGFVPLETPTIEFSETLLGKYGDEERLIYQFTDQGDRNLALRFDLTVPLARYVANNLAVLNPTFSRYQIGQVFRGENPQRGRFREFTQFDFDTVGSSDLSDDAKVIAAAVASARKIGLSQAKMAINDRASFAGINPEIVRAIDKIGKIGIEAAKKEAQSKGATEKEVAVINSIGNLKPTENLSKLFKILKEKYGLQESVDFYFDPTLARGLDYYTGSIFELKLTGKQQELSIGGGGRYDNLIGMFAGCNIPAVGFSFGIDRILEFTS